MPNSPCSLVLVPLDERPVNTRYPQMIGAIAGAEVLLPDPAIRGGRRDSADMFAVARWLLESSRQAAGAIVSADFLCYGNLINARISQANAVDSVMPLSMLEDIPATCPVHAFSLITRVSNADDCVEEPEYWADWGTKFYRYARLTHQTEKGEISEDESEQLRTLAEILPPDLKSDWLIRRLRNHAVNLALLDLAARGSITTLMITSDDTAPYGFPTRERDWLRAWTELIGAPLADRVLMYPGADEVGSVLIARVLNGRASRSPAVYPHYAIPGDEELVAPYEDRPVRETIAGQIRAAGATIAESPDKADIVLGVATPSPRHADYRPEFLAGDREERTQAYQKFLAHLGAWQKKGRSVALADVAYPNGSDPLLAELLLAPDSPVGPGLLSAYGAWNTAGNTLGTVAAQACCSLFIAGDPDRQTAQNLFLAHRFLEDYGYQTVVRREARAEAARLWGRREPAPEDAGEQAVICAFIERRLGEILADLQARGVGDGLRLAPGSVRLPWRRLFEVDFELVAE